MLKIAYSGKSKPSALKIASYYDDTLLVRNSSDLVDVNWGRYRANAALNPDISNVTNKRRMRDLFRQYGIPMPTLYGANNAGVVEFPCVGRPDRHTKGRGFWKCYGMADVLLAMRGTRKKRAATHFMEYIESDREYRVHVFQGKSIRISEKEFDEYGGYTTKKPGDISLRNVREAAKAAVQAVGLDFGAVDILARGDANQNVFVLEVNAAPGVGGTVPQLYAETFERWKLDNDSTIE